MPAYEASVAISPAAIHGRRPPPRSSARSLSQPKTIPDTLAITAPAISAVASTPNRASPAICSTRSGSSSVSSGR